MQFNVFFFTNNNFLCSHLGLHLVRVRAEGMQRCCDKTPGGMLTIKTSPESHLVEAIHAARNHCYFDLKIDLPVTCQIASFLGPEVKVVSGINEVVKHHQFGFQ